MAETTTGPPVVEGWFTTEEPPSLLGLRCTACGARVFPPQAITCPNPGCRSDELEQVALARTGTVWSWAVNHYAPPPPYVAPEPFEPYTVLAVALDGEDLTVLGQLVGDQDPADLELGTPVEVVLGHVLEADENGEPGGAGTRTMFEFRIRE